MSAREDLEQFIEMFIGPDEWAEVCNLIMTSAVMYRQGIVGDKYMNETVKTRIYGLLMKLPKEQLELFDNLLSIDSGIKDQIRDAIVIIRGDHATKQS